MLTFTRYLGTKNSFSTDALCFGLSPLFVKNCKIMLHRTTYIITIHSLMNVTLQLVVQHQSGDRPVFQMYNLCFVHLPNLYMKKETTGFVPGNHSALQMNFCALGSCLSRIIAFAINGTEIFAQ